WICWRGSRCRGCAPGSRRSGAGGARRSSSAAARARAASRRSTSPIPPSCSTCAWSSRSARRASSSTPISSTSPTNASSIPTWCAAGRSSSVCAGGFELAIRPRARALAFAAALLLPALPARAAIEIVLMPGPEGIDTAPYQFTPAVARGNRERLYAFTDPDGIHSFESFLRFALPPDLIGPNERVGAARLELYYSFDFDVYGDTTGVAGSIECREVLAPWSESIDWSQRPAYGPPVDVLTGITELGTV